MKKKLENNKDSITIIKMIGIRMPAGQIKSIKQLALDKNTTMQDIISTAIADYLKKHGV